MKFKKEYGIIYCKDNSYQKKYDNDDFYYKNKSWTIYYKGYLVHRENGSAIEYAFGDKEWYLNGIKCNKKEYWKFINLKNKSRVLDEI